MAVRKRRTAWEVLTKMVRTAVRTRFETIGSGSKQKQNERFAWDFLQNIVSNPVRNNAMAVRKRQTAWEVLTKMVRTAVRTRSETMGSGSKQKQNERFAWDFLQNIVSNLVRNNAMVVRKRQTARGRVAPCLPEFGAPL